MEMTTNNAILWTEITDDQAEVVNGGGGGCYEQKKSDWSGYDSDYGCSSKDDYGSSDESKEEEYSHEDDKESYC